MAYNVLDISRYNSISNYASVAKSIDAAIIRLGYRSYSNTTLIKDSMFTSHYDNFVSEIEADELSTELGLYWQINSITEDEAVEEANYVYNAVKDCSKLSCAFVLSQYGNDDHTGRADSLSNMDRTKILVAFIERLKSFGLFHTVGILMEEDWYDEKIDDTNPNTGNKLSDDYFLWIKNLDAQPQCKYNAWLYTDDDEDIVVGVITQHNMSYFYDAAWKDPEPTETIDVNLCTVSMDESSFVYTGSDITPSINMAYNTELLDEGSDYTLSYENNKNAGTATIIITGIHEYSGTRTTTFEITKAELQSASVGAYDSQYITKPITPSVIVKGVNDETLPDTDYTVSYRDNINVGNGIATITPTETSNYTQDKIVEAIYPITAMQISDWSIEGLQSSYSYTGLPIDPDVSLYRTVDDEKITLTENIDYTKTISNNVDIGTAIITFRGFGNYILTRQDTFNIVDLTIESYTPVLSATNYVYDASIHRPTVKLGNLIQGTHFKVEYTSDCINVGGKTINIYGIGEYAGHLTTTYYIEQKSISSMELKYVDEDIESYEYTSAAFTPKVYIPGLQVNRDYTIEYSNNTNPGQATITATGIGNYIGNTSTTFSISYRSIRDCIGKLGLPTTQSIYRLNGQFYIYSVYPDIKLSEGTDYEILSQYTRSFDDFTLYGYKIKGMGYYFGTYTMRFRICNTTPVLPGTKEDDGVYNFGDIDLGDETAEGYYDFYSLETGDNDEYAANEEGSSSESNEVIYDINKADGDKDFDFEPMSLMLLSTYDIDDGFNIDKDGEDEGGGGGTEPAKPDDGKYNFGDIDLGDETAVGDYDFGDLDEGTDDDSVANGNYDFNLLAGDIEDYMTPGWEYVLDNTPIYPNYDSFTSAFKRSGAYYVYRGEVKNNRIRLTRNEEAAECPVRCTGWADVTVLKNLGKFTVGMQVFATGNLYQYSNGTGNYIEVSSKGMYITEVKESTDAKCPYGVALSYAGNTIGYAEEDMLTKLTD